MNHKEKCKQYYQEHKEEQKLAAKKNRERVAKLVEENKLVLPDIKEKICNRCNIMLDITKFSFRKNRNCYESKCKKCRSIEANEYREMNKEKVLKNNRESHKKRKETDPQYSITCTLRSRMNKVLVRPSKNKILLIGTTKKILMEWLEFNLQCDNLTWDGRGDVWHIDHVIPCNKFDLTNQNEQKICMNWTNLKPMLAHKNIAKHDNILLQQCVENEIRLRLFIKKYEYEIDNFLFIDGYKQKGVLNTNQ